MAKTENARQRKKAIKGARSRTRKHGNNGNNSNNNNRNNNNENINSNNNGATIGKRIVVPSAPSRGNIKKARKVLANIVEAKLAATRGEPLEDFNNVKHVPLAHVSKPNNVYNSNNNDVTMTAAAAAAAARAP